MTMTTIHGWLEDEFQGAAFLMDTVEDVWTVELDQQKRIAADASDFYGFEDESSFAFRIVSVVAWSHRFLSRLINRVSSDSDTDEPPRIHHINTSVNGPIDQTITTVAASILPVLPIVVFYFVENLLVRIGLILVFTAVFSVILVWGFKIKPHASLAITTA